MKTPELDIWQRTSPLAVLFFIGKTIRLLIKNGWQSLAPLVALFASGQFDAKTVLQIGVVGLGLLIVVGSVLSYWFFRFQLTGDSILIRQGVVKKKQLDIKFDRIQGINTRQNPVFRAFKLVTVNFDTAGSSGNEGNLPAVSREFADSLRERIGKKRRTVDTESGEVLEEPATADADVLVSLNWRDMVRIGLADRRALIVFAFIGPLMEQIGEQMDAYIERFVLLAAARGIHFDAASGAWAAAGIVLLVLLLFVLISVTAAFLRYHRFTLWLDGPTLRSRGGLLTTHEHSMDLGKIQTLRLQQGIVESWQSRFKMTARQAKASGKDQAEKIFTIPSVAATTGDRLRRLFYAPEAGRLTQDPRSADFIPISRYYMRSRILFVGLLPALLFAALATIEFGIAGLLYLLWVPLVALFSYRSWKRAGYLHDDDEIVRRSGLLGYRTVGLLFRKVQRVTVSQSRYQRRKGLASLKMYMASGSVRVPYIEHATAKRLRDYILYMVESSDKAWH